MEDFIPIVIQFGELSIKEKEPKKIYLESNMFRVVIETTYFEKQKIWLLTAFDLRKKRKP